MGSTTRTQLSMYVPASAAAELESVRRILDPVQCDLIPAHVTLCREDELASLGRAELGARLADGGARAITLQFGRAVAFDGHGILLPCIAGEQAFIALRRHVLGSRTIRRQAPHITLAHPRNPRSPGNSLLTATRLPDAVSITFTSVSLIQQTGGERWRVLQDFMLQDA